MPMISVIVPVYKVEKYIHRCIDSILAQTFTDFELILVDDGSPDNCGAICDGYAAKDSRIVVIHQENGGLSAQYAIESVDSVTFGITSETPSSGTGKDGITPLLKIENDYWYISYDEGKTWTQEGKAKGDKGDNGEKGDKGDSMFQSVTQDENYVYFTLADGTTIKIAKGNGDNIQDGAAIQIIDGAIMAEFSVSETKKVYFSMGNLQYSTEGSHKCADGTTQPGTWRFAEKQWEEGTLLYWGNTGYNDSIKQVNSDDWYTEEWRAIKYFKSYETIAQSDISNTYNDWGVYNAIENGGNTPNKFRTLTRDEWVYLWEQRPNADKLRGTTKVDGIDCTYLLPDNWDNLEANIPSALYSGKQIYDVFPSVNTLLDKGVVFFRKNLKKVTMGDNAGEGYWSSTYTKKRTYNSLTCYYAYAILGGDPEYQITYRNQSNGTSTPDVMCLPVRLVKDVE